MLIRPATGEDAARCAEIYAPFVVGSAVSFEEEAPDAAEMARRIADFGASHGWLVAEVDGRVAGYAYAAPHLARAAYRHSANVAVYIDPAFARRGIGAALYRALFPLLKEKGVHALFSLITLPNPGSIGLHEALGFAPVGICRETGWKLGRWHDVGWWQILL